MKQKTGFKNLGNTGYRPMNGRHIGINLSTVCAHSTVCTDSD